MRATVINVLSSFLVATTVAVPMATANAPTWAWLGFGLVVYLHEVKYPAATEGQS